MSTIWAMAATRPHLVELGVGTYAFIHPDPKFGNSNVGLVIDADGLTVIDTSATGAQAAIIAEEIAALTSELTIPIRRIALSSSRVAFSGGSQQFWSAAFYGTDVTSQQLDQPANPDVFRRLLPELADAYDDEFTTRPITHVVSETVQLTPAITAVPLPGESAQNLVLMVESANVVFAGALASFGVTPLAFDGYPQQWIETLDQLIETTMTVVPGHGPVGGTADLADLRSYLQACSDTATSASAAQPGTAALPSGPWDRWTDRRFDAVNVERAHLLSAGRDEVPRAMFELLGLGG